HLLGMLVGDGNYTRNEVQFTCADQEAVDALKMECAQFNAEVVQGSRPIDYRIRGKQRKNNEVLNLLRSQGVHGQKSTEKSVPPCIFTGTPQDVVSFLAGLMDTDGTIG